MRILAITMGALGVVTGQMAAAQDLPKNVPVVAAGLKWRVDPEGCQLETPIEGDSMFKTLGFNTHSVGDTVDDYQLDTDEEQMRVPSNVVLLVNGHKPILMPVDEPTYGPANAIVFAAPETDEAANADAGEDMNQLIADKMKSGETVMLFPAFEMISLSSVGYDEARKERRTCLTEMLAEVGIDIDDFDDAAANTRGGADIRGVFSTDDYPAAALRKEEQGTVRAALIIDAQAKVRRCIVISSSGSRLLDNTSCDVMKTRGKFTVARDAEGGPVPSIYLAPPITWQIPQ